jgi:hypothetical protein
MPVSDFHYDFGSSRILKVLEYASITIRFHIFSLGNFFAGGSALNGSSEPGNLAELASYLERSDRNDEEMHLEVDARSLPSLQAQATIICYKLEFRIQGSTLTFLLTPMNFGLPPQ